MSAQRTPPIRDVRQYLVEELRRLGRVEAPWYLDGMIHQRMHEQHRRRVPVRGVVFSAIVLFVAAVAIVLVVDPWGLRHSLMAPAPSVTFPALPDSKSPATSSVPTDAAGPLRPLSSRAPLSIAHDTTAVRRGPPVSIPARPETTATLPIKEDRAGPDTAASRSVPPPSRTRAEQSPDTVHRQRDTVGMRPDTSRAGRPLRPVRVPPDTL